MILPTFRSIHIMKSLYLHYYPLHIHPHRLFHSPSIALFSSPISARNRPVFPFSYPLPVHLKASQLPSIRSHASMPPEGSDPSPMEVRPLFGEIHVIIGPMFAGKTTALIRRLQLAIDGGRKVAMVKSDKDTRYGLDSVVSHDGVKMPCFALQELSVLRSKIGDDAYAMLDVIGIDEAQFFEDIYDFCRIAADLDGKTVIVAGLDGDYLRKRFGAVLDIIPLADSVTKLTSKCEICRRPAFFTLRKSDESETELIGGADLYMPVCRRHYVDGQLVIETTRYLLETQKTMCEPCYEAEPVSRF